MVGGAAVFQSAGAAILTWLLLAENGTLQLPFDQAWIASPTIAPRKDLERNRPVWEAILNATGCEDLACMRNVSENVMLEADRVLFQDLPIGIGGGSFGPGVGLTPTVDGELLSDVPVSVLQEGKMNRDIKALVVGNTAAEVSLLSYDREVWSITDNSFIRAKASLPTEICLQGFRTLFVPISPTSAIRTSTI